MSEARKTAIFLTLAAAFLLLAWVSRPAGHDPIAVDDSGERFFTEFDPLEATSLEIIEFDEETATPRVFQVAQQNGVWSIPSHENYPADAKNQLAEAAGGIVDLIKGPNISDRPADHELYGVVDPTATDPGATGVGTRVTLKNESADVLAEFIIGNQVMDRPELRYVRLPQIDRVYTTKVSTDKLSTRFEDWIEKDLLQLDPNDIVRVLVNNYSIDEINQLIRQGDRINLTFDDTDRVWSLEGHVEGETLAIEKLDELKRALDDLQIIDVHRKPAGLSGELRAEDQLVLDAPAIRSLRARGYFVVGGRLLSNQGELIVSTKSGVQYVLRFGEIALGQPAPEPDPQASGADGATTAPSAGANRYLFVTARFNADLIEKPDLEDLPEPTAPAEPDEADASQDEPPATEPDEPAEDQETRRIRQENERKQAEYDRTLEAGRTRVRELNDRFADWYYVISDTVYTKIRLQRADVVKAAQDERVPTAPGS